MDEQISKIPLWKYQLFQNNTSKVSKVFTEHMIIIIIRLTPSKAVVNGILTCTVTSSDTLEMNA